ncbi:MAG: type I-U CRISPR-associated protein Cas7 [Chthoniobacterales bacterium]|nr:type I-U CRISPR-associated protein Cas7 [Chthoniobacterales bacterium]
MTIDYPTLEKTPRLLAQVKLRPVQGHRFQPTGFSDLGPARYTLPDSTEMLLVESNQSVANRMEAACWDAAKNELISELAGLPYIVVKEGERFITASVLEAHRINSEYIMRKLGKSAGKSKGSLLDPDNIGAETEEGGSKKKKKKPPTDFHLKFATEIGYAADQPIDWRRFYDALLKYDPCSLIHGCFLEEIAGRLRIMRALSGFIEASNVSVAESGGVKNSLVNPELKQGEGNVPFARTEFVAKEIVAFFNLDLALLRGFGFASAPTQLLIALSLFKIQRFLSTGLRLRTACDLMTVGHLEIQGGLSIPPETDLLTECTRLMKDKECVKHFADAPITVVTR